MNLQATHQARADAQDLGNVSTFLVFNSTGTGGFDLNADQLASPISPQALAPDGQPIKLRDIPEIIANPASANFFNTDCVSCHTESSRRISPGMQPVNASLHYQRTADVSGVDPAVLPQSSQENWNLRNFGWFPNFFSGNTDATVTQRTANEAAASADYINRVYFNQQVAPAAPVAQTLTTPPSPPPVAQGPIAEMSTSHGLTLIMKIKEPADLQALAALLDPQTPSDQAVNKITQDRITAAMNKIGTVHFARFVIRPDQMELMVITDFDGDFSLYIAAFTDAIGGIFDQLLVHTADGAGLVPVSGHEDAFLKYVQDHDASFDKETNSPRPSYSAYPTLKVQDILTLLKQAAAPASPSSAALTPAK